MRTLLLFITLLIGNFCFAQILTNGLIAQYDFTNGSLTDTKSSATFTQTGTAMTLVDDRFGGQNNAIHLNGDYLKRPDLASGNNVSYSFWIKTSTNTPDLKTIIDDSQKNSLTNIFAGYQTGYSIMLKDGKITAQARVSYAAGVGITGFESRTVESNFIANDGWHHVVVVFKVYSKNYNPQQYADAFLYIDGVLKSTQAAPLPTTFGAGGIETVGELAIGNNRNNTLNNNLKYNDIIDDIYVYNRELIASEVLLLAQIGGYCLPLDPSVLTASSVTQTEATINLPNNGTHDIAYHKVSDNFSNAIIVPGITSTTLNLTGLDVFTAYKVYVRKHCTTNLSAWSNPIGFDTQKPAGLNRIYVNKNATGNNNGISWTNAYTKLEDALAALDNNDEIWIAEGTYKPHASDKTVPFTVNARGIKIYGGFAGTETQLSDRVFGMNETILSGDLLGNDTYDNTYGNPSRNDNSFTVLDLLGDDIVLDGLTITGGNSIGANGTPTESRYGGAIHKNTATRNLTLTNCKIIRNMAKEGGGALSVGFSADGGTSSLTINNCEFSDNLSALGGAIYSANIGNSTTTYTISNSLFSKNKVMNTSAGGTGYAGSSMWLRSYGAGSNVISNITNCTFADNIDAGTASGMSNTNRTTLALTQNTGTTHTATISNSIFWNNKVSAGAVANPIGGFMESIVSSATIKNSIDETNFNGVTLSGSSANNSAANPLFTNLANGDYTLSSGSPAIDSGNNSTVVGTADLLGKQRIFNTTVDMGPYEFGSLVLSTPSFSMFSDFTLYPNPANSVLNIQSSETVKSIEIFSITGKKILTTSGTQINISNLASGIYFIKITTDDNKVGTKKLIKN